jgi:hypothetical protein
MRYRTMHARPRWGTDAADRIRIGCGIVSVATCVFLVALYTLRPPGWDPITIWPFVFWAWPGVVFGLASLSRAAKRRSLLVAAVWVIALLAIPEEPRALLRSVGHSGEEAWRAARAEGRALRVASLNCGAGSVGAARELLAHDPDIVLLQERPGMHELEDVFEEASGWQGTGTLDTAVFVRGELEALPPVPRQQLIICLARVQPSCLDPPQELIVASIHLFLPATRADIWRPSTWREAEQTRAVRAGQMARVAAHAAAARGRPTIVGGDFNTPGGDGLFRPLRHYLRDAFPEAGVGWPNTMVNDSPVSRIDQVWTSAQLRATTLRAVRTRNSDHRMLVCDLVLP